MNLEMGKWIFCEGVNFIFYDSNRSQCQSVTMQELITQFHYCRPSNRTSASAQMLVVLILEIFPGLQYPVILRVAVRALHPHYF